MVDTAHCPDCGAPLDENGWSEELCPHCLMKLALEESSSGDLEAADSATALTRDLPSQTLSQGQVLGKRYGIRSLLGRGGMGEVWRAFDLKLRVEVALKAVRPDLLEKPRAMDALRSEVRAAREVTSPNVCRVYDLEELDGLELVSMEFVQGDTLRDVLRARGPMEIQEAREVASQLLAGLEAIHHANLVHRDLKPENVMITPSSRVVVMDFGIAKGLADAGAGTVSGTPAYMPPEQSRGEAVDARADVYSAGFVLVEMLAPKGDNEAASRQALFEGMRSDPPQLPDSPWRAVLEQAVAPSPAHRIATAATLSRALEEVTIRVDGAEDVAPYPGLVSFGEQDQQYFFGRELEVERMWKTLRRLSMLALIGPSGAGKTSFLKAGLLASEPRGWTHVICTPGESPLTSLRQALAPALSGDSEAIRDLVKVEDPEAMVSAVSRWRAQSKRALLVVDQFEELFTLNPRETQAEFSELLGRLAIDADVRVLLSMRDDFLIHCHAHEPLRPILSELTLLGPPTGAALRRAVVQPALKCGYRFEDEKLVDEMLGEVQGERGALPLLAFAAEQLWERRDRENGHLTREAYEVIGGVGGALAQHAELTLERIGSDRVPVIREIFRNLVTPQGTRAVRDRDELLSLFKAGGEVSGRESAAQVLDALIDARLLTSYGVEGVDGQTEAQQRIEIVHESLLSAWPRLVHWQAQDVEGAKLRDDLRHAARRWQERDRPDDLLWVGSALQEFHAWRERYQGSLTEIEEAFGKAMARFATRRRRRRRMVLATSFAAVVLVVVVLGAMWRFSGKQSGRAKGSKLVTLGYNALEGERTDALAYAIAALSRADTAEARHLALRALWAGPPSTVVPTASGNPLDFAFAPDGSLVAVSYEGGLVRVHPRDGGTPTDLSGFEERGNVLGLSFSPDARYLVGSLAEEPCEVRVWETEGWQTERVLQVPDVMRAAGYFEPGGTAIFTVTAQPLEEAPASGDRNVRWQVDRWPLADGPPQRVGSVEGNLQPTVMPDISRGLLPVGRGKTVEVHSFSALGTEPGRVIARHPAHFGPQFPVAIDPSGDRVAFSDLSGDLCVWPFDGDGRRPERCIKAPQRAFSMSFSPDGSMLVLATFARGGQLWDLRGPAGAGPLRYEREEPVTFKLDFSPDGRWSMSSGPSGLCLWPVTNRYRRTLPGHEGGVSVLAFARDGTRLFSQGGSDGTILSWDLSAGAGVDPTVVFQTGESSGVGLSADPLGRYLIAAYNTGLWKVPLDGSEPTLVDGGINWKVAIDPSGRLIARKIYSVRRNPTVIVQDLESGKKWELDGPGEGHARFWAFDSNGRLLVTRGDVLSRWDPATEATEVLLEGRLWAARPLPDGRAYVSGETRFILDLEDGARTELPSVYQPDYAGYPVRFDSTGSISVVGIPPKGEIHVGRVFDEQPHVILDDEGGFTQIRISPDGRWIAGIRPDGAVLLWPTPDLSRRPVHTLPYNELMTKLKALTNLRAVPDEQAATGYRVEPDFSAYRGWEEVPTW